MLAKYTCPAFDITQPEEGEGAHFSHRIRPSKLKSCFLPLENNEDCCGMRVCVCARMYVCFVAASFLANYNHLNLLYFHCLTFASETLCLFIKSKSNLSMLLFSQELSFFYTWDSMYITTIGILNGVCTNTSLFLTSSLTRVSSHDALILSVSIISKKPPS